MKENLRKSLRWEKSEIPIFLPSPPSYYNLDVVISVGYRVKSHQGTKFRQWATARLKEYIVKGFTINDDLLRVCWKTLKLLMYKLLYWFLKIKVHGFPTILLKTRAFIIATISKFILLSCTPSLYLVWFEVYGYIFTSQNPNLTHIWAFQQTLLKQAGGGNYFDELLARIRDIRSSEKVFWRKVLDIYSTSIDYDPSLEMSVMFFKTVQNKMHWAAHGQT